MTHASGGIEFWFEFASTYSYVAVHDVLALGASVPFRFRPFLLGPIFAESGWKDSPFNLYPTKGRYMWRDVSRLCESRGLPFKRPSRFPRSGLFAARIAVSASQEAWMPEFCRRVYAANFAEDREISEPSVIDEIAAGLGLSGAALREQAGTPAAKQALKDETSSAARLGIFGAPTFVTGGELFWGSDRLPQAVAWWRARVPAP